MGKTTCRRKGVFEVGLMVPVGYTHHHHGSGRQAQYWGSSWEITPSPTEEREHFVVMRPVYWHLKGHSNDIYPIKWPQLLICFKIFQPSGEQALYDLMGLLTFKLPQRCWIGSLCTPSQCNRLHGVAGYLIMLCCACLCCLLSKLISSYCVAQPLHRTLIPLA